MAKAYPSAAVSGWLETYQGAAAGRRRTSGQGAGAVNGSGLAEGFRLVNGRRLAMRPLPVMARDCPSAPASGWLETSQRPAAGGWPRQAKGLPLADDSKRAGRTGAVNDSGLAQGFGLGRGRGPAMGQLPAGGSGLPKRCCERVARDWPKGCCWRTVRNWLGGPGQRMAQDSQRGWGVWVAEDWLVGLDR
jgi:hypothetical protein